MSDPLIARSAIPTNTAVAWAGKDGIYVQFPTKSGVPYVSRFAKTPQGLQDALSLLLENPMPRSVNLAQPGHPAVRRFGSKMQASPELQATTSALVKRMLK